MASPRRDVYQEITNKIIAMLEEGKRPWLQPWQDGEGVASFPIRSTGEPYRGINVLLLWSEAADKGYNSPYWFTYKQAAALKAHVRKGETGTTIVYAGSIQRTDTDEKTGEDIEQNIPFMKAYTVFNACQIDGLDASHFTNENVPQLLSEADRIAAVDMFFKNTGADIRHGGNKAFYRPSGDYVQMPNFAQFASPEAYASTLAHEMCHWTKAPKRLNRDFGAKAFGDEGYGREELVALS